MMRNILKTIIFMSIFAVLFTYVNGVVCFKERDGIYNFKIFDELEEDTVDVMIYGSSHAYENINPAVLYKDYGIASFILGGSEQPLWNTYYFIKESLKTQKPKLLLIEVSGITFSNEYNNHSRIIKNNYGLKLSKDKVEALKASSPEDKLFEYIVEPFQYHGRYNNILREDFEKYLGQYNYYKWWKGFACNFGYLKLEQPVISENIEKIELSDKSELYYRKILEFVKNENIPTCLIVSPYYIPKEDWGMYSCAEKIASEYGIPFINFNLYYEDIGVDFSKDMADIDHMNYIGSEKYSKFLGEKLKNDYDLPDRRDNEKYYSWEMNNRYYENIIENYELKLMRTAMEFINKISLEDYTVIITYDNKNYNYDTIGAVLKSMGIDEERKSLENVWVISEGECIYSSGEEESFFFKEVGKSDIAITKGSNSSSIVVNNVNLTKGKNEINIVLYNNFTDEVADSVGFNLLEDICVRK